MDVKTREVDNAASASRGKKSNTVKYLLDACIIVVMCGLLYYGASWQMFAIYTDAAKYECYAVAFWQGTAALQSFPVHQCDNILHPDPTIPLTSNTSVAEKLQRYGVPQGLVQFVAGQSPSEPFHALPREYPLLDLIPFSLVLIAPSYWYQVAFAVLMALVVAVIYWVLTRFRSRRAAFAYAIYLVIGCWGTALGRFDLIPSALTLFALVCAVRKRWNWAFVWLALGTLFKFYPAVLVLPFLLAQQMEAQAAGTRWLAWRRWQPLALFAGLCVVVMGSSLLLSVGGTIDPLRYFGNRPVQVESFQASLMWIVSHLNQHVLLFRKTFGSLNVFDAPGYRMGALSSAVSLLGTVLLGAGLLYTYWLQWRRKISLPMASLLTLLIVMLTGKVFSPQYLIWVAPLVAYVGETDLRWLFSWSVIGVLTTWIYPYIYNMSKSLDRVPYIPLFFPVTTIRNLLLLGFIAALLWYGTWMRRASASSDSLRNGR